MSASENLNSEEIIRELCTCNGLIPENIEQDGPGTTTLEMFFSGYPKMVGLSYFPNLIHLILVGQNIQAIEGLESCPLLQELWIAECNLTTIEGLHHCTHLKKVFLYHNNISNIEGLETLQKLEVLWLNENEIKVIKGMDQLHNLKELNLAGNLIHSIGECLDLNVQLERLNLSGNKISSFQEITNLARLANLKDLSLKDPQFRPNPVCLLCNYATHVLYHIPQLQRLDTYDVSDKQIKDLADSTVLKKMMYYNMRVKAIQRQQEEEIEKVNQIKYAVKRLPEEQMKELQFMVKNLENELHYQQLSGNIPRRAPVSHGSCKSQDDIEESVRMSREESARNDSNLKEQMCKKIDSLKGRILFWTERLQQIDRFYENEVLKTKESFDLLVQFLQTELETVGNVRFEEGSPSDAWFKSCSDLILSRFCERDFKAFGISRLKINRIVRVHNRILRKQFEDKLQYLLDLEQTGFSKNYRKMMDYLFKVFYPKSPVNKKDLLKCLRDGFRTTKQSKMYEQKQDEPVLLSNSMGFCEGSRLEFLRKQAVTKESRYYDPELFKYGRVVISKVFIANSVQACPNLPIIPENYETANSVFKPQNYENSDLYSPGDGICFSKEHRNCECRLRQCEWFVFDPELVLPEYVIEFEYVPMEHSSLFPKANSFETEDLSHELQIDETIIKMEPVSKPKPKIVSLDETTILSVAKANIYSQITVLNLHGNSLSKLKEIAKLNGLRKLVISFNEFSTLEDISYLPSLEYLDASHNRVLTLEGLRALEKLKYLDLSWNQLTKTKEEISTLCKQATQLQSLNIQCNPWLKPSLVNKIAIGQLKSLTHLNGLLITEDDITEAELFFSGTRISLMSLMTNCRTDDLRPRCLSIMPSAQILSRISPNCILPGEVNANCYSMITSVNFDGQNIFRITNLEKLENLRWASFSNNFLTKIEGLERCVKLEELSLDGNCIVNLEGLSKLTELRHLSINNNQLASFDGDIDKLNHLHFLSAEYNNITSLAGLQKATTLFELYLSYNKIDNNQEIYYVKGLTNLVILDLLGNPISLKNDYRLFVIFHHPTLKALDGRAVESTESENAKDVFGGRLSSDMIAEKIGHQNFLELTELNWRTSSIRSVSLVPAEQFTNIHTVNLENNKLESFSGLIFLSNIKILYLNYNHIESILPRQKSQYLTNRQILHQTVNSSGYGKQGTSRGNKDPLFSEPLTPIMQSLEVLHLGYNGISNLPQLQLNRLTHLKSLYLQGNEISQVEGLESLEFLQELVLDHNRIKRVTETSFAKQHSLVFLHLEENRIRELNLPPLMKLKKLLLGFNKIQEISDVEKLEALPALLELSISGNPVSSKTFHRPLLVLRLQNLQILDGIAVTAEERARAEMHFLEQQALSLPNSGVDVVYPVPSFIMIGPPPLRVNHFSGADIHLSNAHEESLGNEANRYKKSKHHATGVLNNPRTLYTEFKQLRGGINISPCYLPQQNGQNRVLHPYQNNQEHEVREMGAYGKMENKSRGNK
ncbi:leucine-rich repeat-containing protein 9 [Pelobates fuscus]|uniref:leucine-rich repeat-containing protein 9 n=1 Tax=Pelobates fuscus TaxID=191477 RepID=UPI002FE4792A